MANNTHTEYLGCKIGFVNVGIAIDSVQEVFESQMITRVPECPDFVLGMVNIRGNIIPVLDLWKVRESSKSIKQIVILNTSEGMVGLLITALIDLIRFNSIQQAINVPEELNGWKAYFPNMGQKEETSYLLNVNEIIAKVLSENVR